MQAEIEWAIVLVPCCLVGNDVLCSTTNAVIKKALELSGDDPNILFVVIGGDPNLTDEERRQQLGTSVRLELLQVRAALVDWIPERSLLHEILDSMQYVEKYSNLQGIHIICPSCAMDQVKRVWHDFSRHVFKGREISSTFHEISALH